MIPLDTLRNLSVLDARARMLDATAFLGQEPVPLGACLGRILAQALIAKRDQPPFDASAMDGWAMRSADAVSGARLKIVGESAAGHPFVGHIELGQTVRVSTGAPIPDGAERVIIQEEAVREGDELAIKAANGSDHIRPRGGDLAAGTIVLSSGERLDPWRVALAAAAGYETVAVARRPYVAILVNGEELARPGQTPQPWQISDSAGPGLAGLIQSWGGAPVRLPQVGDDSAAITGAIAGTRADLIVTIGGASVGDHDLVKPALATLGLRLQVETINVRPGKPTWFGLLGDGRRVLGLPGNPASAFVCAQLFLRPLILAMLGAEPQPCLEAAVLQADLEANGPRETWLRAEFTRGEAGHAQVRAFGQQDSSLIGVFAKAGALLPRAASAPKLQAGTVVPILRLDRPT